MGVVAAPRESSEGPDVELIFLRSALLGEALYGDLWGLGEAVGKRVRGQTWRKDRSTK